ncbi:AraC-like DNA-binding protein [Pseudomonas sp. JUb42]|jgi:AraC-like DNA-binding protein|uniref:AraC family transcriptional regulator n=1 Tax=Pseudomonas sp. JUb42 TaxID=2940611 RepID=UPI002166E762|nr:AraC family transcriptional regulator [Pseudomonas sp. JUb42]MCS3467276.1 AraC-like DNA-binding protein [Pseudomonas sp. JUb42]
MLQSYHSDANAALVALIKPLATRPGFVATRLPQVNVVSLYTYVASSPQIYEPSLMIIAQGGKFATLGTRTLDYGAGHYLVQALSVPFMCETFATPQEPLFGVSVAIDRVVLGELVQALGEEPDQIVEAQTPESMTSVVLDTAMRESLERLLRCLHDPRECQAMGQARLREVLYAALRGPQSGVLRALVTQQSHFARVAGSLAYLHSHFSEPLNVETLARQANMSASTFHEHFKRSTLLSPVQYLKRLRLLKAQHLLIVEGLGVAQVALRVGYQSTSQFSREYKRYFQRNPGEEGSRAAMFIADSKKAPEGAFLAAHG